MFYIKSLCQLGDGVMYQEILVKDLVNFFNNEIGDEFHYLLNCDDP